MKLVMDAGTHAVVAVLQDAVLNVAQIESFFMKALYMMARTYL